MAQLPPRAEEYTQPLVTPSAGALFRGRAGNEEAQQWIIHRWASLYLFVIFFGFKHPLDAFLDVITDSNRIGSGHCDFSGAAEGEKRRRPFPPGKNLDFLLNIIQNILLVSPDKCGLLFKGLRGWDSEPDNKSGFKHVDIDDAEHHTTEFLLTLVPKLLFGFPDYTNLFGLLAPAEQLFPESVDMLTIKSFHQVNHRPKVKGLVTTVQNKFF